MLTQTYTHRHTHTHTQHRRSRSVGRLVMLALAIALPITACQQDSPVAPESADVSLRIRKTEWMCVPPSDDTTNATPVLPDAQGGCPPGFDHVPWT